MTDKVIWTGCVDHIIGVKHTGSWPNHKTTPYLKEKDTTLKTHLPCVYIFTDYQMPHLQVLKDNLPKGVKIIYESEKAINLNYPGSPPRNVLIIVDKDEEQAVS